jgi:hypothetical protein
MRLGQRIDSVRIAATTPYTRVASLHASGGPAGVLLPLRMTALDCYRRIDHAREWPDPEFPPNAKSV